MVDLPNLDHGPERLFGVRDLAQDGTHVLGEMVATQAALGPSAVSVLVDDVLGYAILSGRPPGQWSVSTEIAVDFVAAVPADGSVLRAEGWLVDSSATGGLALGRVLDQDGRVLAHCRQRGRFVPLGDGPVGTSIDRAELCDVTALLDPVSSGELELKIEGGLVNPLGNLHGGVSFAVSERLAGHALSNGPALTTQSVHITYVRPIAMETVAIFTAEVVHRGRSLGVARITSTDPRGKPCTVATVVQH